MARHRRAAGQGDLEAGASPSLSAGAVRRRSRRQDTALLALASAAALWLGMSAPGVSPVAPPVAASTVAGVGTTDPGSTTDPANTTVPADTTDPGNTPDPGGTPDRGPVGGGRSLPDEAGAFDGGGGGHR